MIFVTGDTHAEFNRFSLPVFPEQREMTRDDIVIICGDFGGVWNDSKEQIWWRKWLSQKPFTILFVDGNHENFDLLSSFPVEEWHGGKTHKITDNIRHLMRGQVFTIDGLRFFTFGGARSHDIRDGILDPALPDFKRKKKALEKQNAWFRILGVSWWPQEMPNKEEYEEGKRNLDAVGWGVDFILTHCAPAALLPEMKITDEPDPLNRYLDQIHEKCSYRHWFFGHYHKNQNINEKDHLIYEQIIRIQ